jgi:GLEYA domain
VSGVGTQASIAAQDEETVVCQLAFSTAKPLMRYYDGAGGGTLASIPSASAPFTAAELLVNGLVAPTPVNRADNYSARSRGYIRPTISGTYTIYISSDDAGAFSLGAANGSTSGLAVSVSNAGYSGAQGSTGASFTVALVAGVAYPYELVYSEGAGGDYVQVDWAGPVGARQVIPAAVIFAENPNSLSKRQLVKRYVDGVPTYEDLDGNPVTITAAQPLVDCAADYSFPTPATAATPLSSVLPLADGVGDAQRTGAIGTSAQAARADHVHPIVRLAQLTMPNVVVGGGTFVAQTVWAQYTTEETQNFRIRVQMQATAAGTWRTINFPAIAGYNIQGLSLGGLYCPATAAANPFTGQHFLWGNTFYWDTPAAFINTDCYWNFDVEYILA